MMAADRRKHDDDEADASPFDGLQKNAVLHEARVFNEAPVDAQKCAHVMTKILYLLGKGERFTSAENSTLFFSVTKLFQARDVHLRRMIYLVIKELNVESDESLIVVSCLSKDMVSDRELFKANAIRTLAKVIDASMLGQIDRFLKQAIVDKNPFITSSSLMAGIHMFNTGPDVIKRWVNEVQEALQNKSKMVQYHALHLLYKIKRHDRLAINKVVTALVRKPPTSPMACCLLIRYLTSVLVTQGKADTELLKFLNDQLHNKSFMVMYEAARALCRLPTLNSSHVAPAVTVLQEFLTSPVPAQRFAAVRTLSQVVSRFPGLVSPASSELEHLIQDRNRSIATLAITTLLKTGEEANVDRLMKTITGFMSEISDEFKIVLVDAIKTLCLKFPHKYEALVGFLSTALRDEGGASYKRAIVNAMFQIIDTIPAAKQEGLEHFCEFIEDCEFVDLAVKILHRLGDEGPNSASPSRFIRFIYNRIILEAPPVRAAAVSALASFGSRVPSLTTSVITLLKRALTDNDDEVRDRVVFYLNRLQSGQAQDVHTSIPAKSKDLEYSLQLYLQSNTAVPFNIKQHLMESDEVDEVKVQEEKKKTESVLPAADVPFVNPYLDLLNSIPEFAALGKLVKSCPPVALTEEESEYVVSCVKHVFPEHIVFQYNVTNSLEDQVLENVSIEMEAEDDAWAEELLVPEAKIAYGVTGASFVAMRRPDGAYTSGAITCELQFQVKEVDVASGEIAEDASDETYQLEDIEVNEKDFMTTGDPIGLIEFRRLWEGLADAHESVKKFSLGLDDLQAAVNAIIDLLGMTACEDSATVADDASSHACNLYGSFLGTIPVFCRAGFMLDAKSGVTLKLAVRCTDETVATLLASCPR